jgi:ESCRT-I complex subunit VPS28
MSESVPRTLISFNVSDERKVKHLCDLYEIIRTTEALESAYINDATSGDEYTKSCNSLISQFNNVRDALKKNGSIANVEDFMKEYNMECPLARGRLLDSGVPATVLHAVTANAENDKSSISKATANFITLLDQLELDERSVASIVQTLTELCIALNKLSIDYDGKNKMTDWLKRLNTTMHATDTLSDRDKAQLLSDVEQSYTTFSGAL